jgi:hypothetical protein
MPTASLSCSQTGSSTGCSAEADGRLGGVLPLCGLRFPRPGACRRRPLNQRGHTWRSRRRVPRRSAGDPLALLAPRNAPGGLPVLICDRGHQGSTDGHGQPVNDGQRYGMREANHPIQVSAVPQRIVGHGRDVCSGHVQAGRHRARIHGDDDGRVSPPAPVARRDSATTELPPWGTTETGAAGPPVGGGQWTGSTR